MSTVTTLRDTDAYAIGAALVDARTRLGSPALGMVLTLVVLCTEEDHEAALETAVTACREHPARIVGLVAGSARGTSRIDAEIRSGLGVTGEEAVIHLKGPVAHQTASVVVPLLLPDSPVVAWWPTRAPADPATDPVGALASRRITDAASATRGKARAMLTQCRQYAPGNTDLAWTRVTPWRALLAAALDHDDVRVIGASVTAERISPSADLLGAWLGQSLKVAVERHNSGGPGITEVALRTREGDVTITRTDGRNAVLSSPGQPDRPIALKRRTLADLLAEELRRLDPDVIYQRTVKHLARAQESA